MNLSLYTGGVKPYLEYGWVCAPNTAGQSIAANTITTLTIDTEVADTGGFGSIASNQITLAAGTYYFEANVFGYSASGTNALVFSLYNNTTSLNVSGGGGLAPIMAGGATSFTGYLKGQFTILSSNVFSLRIALSGGATISNSSWSSTFSLATAGADQRTTIKLWKLA